jgi:NTP pyrophosphatase (non-canonical NTP hydrolase)
MFRRKGNTMAGKTLNELRDEAFAYAEKRGFHKNPINFGERLMLVVSELSEALEADRRGVYTIDENIVREFGEHLPTKKQYETIVRGTIQEELADAIIRIADIAGIYGFDLDWHVAAKMAYNKTRPYLHGKRYG